MQVVPEGRQRHGGNQEGQPVRFGPHHGLDAQIAAGAAAVVDHHRLAQLDAQRGRQQPRDGIERAAAAREGHDRAQRMIGPGRLAARRARHGGRHQAGGDHATAAQVVDRIADAPRRGSERARMGHNHGWSLLTSGDAGLCFAQFGSLGLRSGSIMRDLGRACPSPRRAADGQARGDQRRAASQPRRGNAAAASHIAAIHQNTPPPIRPRAASARSTSAEACNVCAVMSQRTSPPKPQPSRGRAGRLAAHQPPDPVIA
jgi:hypothetical protein